MTKKPKPKKIKKPYQKCIELAKLIAKERDGYQCRHCPRTRSQGWQIQGSHVLGVGAHPEMATYPINIKALCVVCHNWWHSAPTESGDWFKKTYPEQWEEIEKLRKERQSTLKKLDYQKRYIELKAELEALLK